MTAGWIAVLALLCFSYWLFGRLTACDQRTPDPSAEIYERRMREARREYHFDPQGYYEEHYGHRQD